MKKITSLILAMAMVFSLSAQVFALNDDMQDNENSEANMIVITTSKEERDKQFNDAMAKVMEQLEGPTLTRDNKERFKYEHFDYQYKTLSGGYKFPTGGGFYFSDSGGPNVSGSVSLSLPAPYNFVSISVGLGNRSTTSGLYVTVPNKTDYFKLYVEKEMEVRPYAIYKQNKHTREYELYTNYPHMPKKCNCILSVLLLAILFAVAFHYNFYANGREIVGTFSTGNNISNDDLYITFFRDNKFLIYRQDADILSGSYDIDEIGGTIIARIIGTDGTTYLAICIKSSLIVLVRTDTVDSYELTKISKKPMIIGHSSDMITE